MDLSKVKLPEPASKPAFDAQLDDLIGGDDTGTEHRNPMLDETDEPTFLPGSTPAPAAQVTPERQQEAATSTPDQPWKRDRTPEELAALDTRAANGELLPGRKKKDAYRFGWLTSIDLEVIWTVASARLIKAESVQVAREWKRVEAAYKRLRRLENGGLVRAQRVVGVGQVWTVTTLGLRTLRANGFEARWTKGPTSEADAFPYVGPGDISLQNVHYTLALAHVRAQLLRGGYYDLQFGEEGSCPVAPAQLISEWTMKTSWEALTGSLRDGSRHEDRLIEANTVAAAFRQRVTEGRGTWEEAFISAPMLWVPAYPPVERNYRGEFGPESSVEHGGSHLPDLVVSRLASQWRLNVNTALEVELTYKKVSDSRMKQLHTAPRITYAVHQLRVRSDASICLVPAADPHSTTVEHRAMLPSLERDWDVVAYLNEHEDEGSISLSVRARMLEPLWSARAVTWFLYAPARFRRRFVVFEKGWSTTQLYFR